MTPLLRQRTVGPGTFFEEIAIPAGVAPYPGDINNAGVVSGTYSDPNTGRTYSFLWYNGKWSKIARVDPQSGMEEEVTSVASIADTGMLVGNWVIARPSGPASTIRRMISGQCYRIILTRPDHFSSHSV